MDGGTRLADLSPPGSPAFDAGLEKDDQITAIDGRPVASWSQVLDTVASHRPGDIVRVDFRHRSGTTDSGTMTLKEDPTLEVAFVEDSGGTPTAEQKVFRDAWLGPRIR